MYMNIENKKYDSDYSKTVGGYVGSVLSLLFLSELVTPSMYEQPISSHTVYLNGFVLVIFGAYIISKHNIWRKDWTVLVTLSGWLMTLLGIYRLFFPTAPQAPVSTSTYIAIAVLLLIELFVTAKSFSK